MLASQRNALSSVSADETLNFKYLRGISRARGALWLVVLTGAVLGCSSKNGTSMVDGSGASSGTGASTAGNGSVAGTTGFILPDGGGVDPEGGTVSDLTVSPANPVLVVTIANGMITSVTGGADSKGTVPFQAMSGGMAVPAVWSIDRGELGTLDVSGGSFVPNGNFSGVGVVSALYGKAVATTQVTIKLNVTQNGGTWDPTPVTPGVGGIGGVGGEAPGGPVDDATQTLLLGTPQMPANAGEFGLLYPYDGTVAARSVCAAAPVAKHAHVDGGVRAPVAGEFRFSGVLHGRQRRA